MHKAVSTLTATNEIGSTAEVSYATDGKIVLSNGFKASEGSYFIAYVGICDEADTSGGGGGGGGGGSDEEANPLLTLRLQFPISRI